MPASTKVFVIPGRFAFERLEDHEVESKSEADRLVATGAFALSKKDADVAAYTSAVATEADDSNVKQPHKPEEPAPEPEPASDQEE